ncbi:ABC-type sugar transport system substrate-binding protein [Bradyrhizobium sp. CIR48]|uniref:sugar ABC transporter substrate-binding protein n=1 Tax=Bradyrhizobium sp. CIR48 TaxID=2663840 RepID=UPI001605B476|nr:sugar ABC transporter substrate-binding protein [Bradyrhizobium sp. CIR48]MBB4425426.1 ABC-type sugar transport system substrate-binding protein [Bradyrhizobium sp. CIR48]
MKCSYIGFAVSLAAASFLGMSTVSADQLSGAGSSKELKQRERAAVEGKTIAYVPQILASPLATEWARVLKDETAALGMKLIVKDPNWNANAQLQVISALIDEKPNVLVVQNPNVTILAKELERAEKAGIYVIQINQGSNYKTDAYTGGDWESIGKMMADHVIKKCGNGSNTSGKVQIVMGEATAGASLEQTQAVLAELKKDPAIKVVSNQAADWDASKAQAITSTVLQQHSDLCASIGMWGVMQRGAAQAIKDAGKLDQVTVVASGEGVRSDCDALQEGLFDGYANYDARLQGHDIVQLAKLLLQSGQKAGTFKIADFSHVVWLDKQNGKGAACFDP